MPHSESIGERLKRERVQAGLTQREVAQRVNVGVPHISKVEAGRENPSDELLERIARLFHIDADELLLAARRVPENLIEKLALNPHEGIKFLRRFDQRKPEGRSAKQSKGTK